MAEKCALIVDDSRVARTVLHRMLQRYSFIVDEAATGEEALDFLHYRRPDVIFMDHMMPGIDGLEAVKIIKDNPITATVPVVMYTSKKGELYVGQARALGAVGILPKEIEPSELYKVLHSLDLVKNRRSLDAGSVEKSSKEDSVPLQTSLSPESLQEVARIAAESVETSPNHKRIEQLLEEQRALLCNEIRSSYRATVDEVTRNFVDSAQVMFPAHREEDNEPPRRSAGFWISVLLILLLTLPLIWLYQRYNDVDTALKQAVAQNEALRDINRKAPFPVLSADPQLAGPPLETTGNSTVTQRQLLRTIEWALNAHNTFGYKELALSDVRLDMVRDMVTRLAAASFKGTVLLKVQFGQFCQVRDELGQLRLAPKDLPLEECEVIGPGASRASAGLVDQQSLAFGSFISGSPLLDNTGIEMEIQEAEYDVRQEGILPSTIGKTAGEWNQAAAKQNRVFVHLIPSGEAH